MVLEGRLWAIQLQGKERLTLAYLCDRILIQVERNLRLLSLNLLLENISATLKESGQRGIDLFDATVELEITYKNKDFIFS